MTFYFVMINAWSLAWEVLNGTMDETYQIREDVPDDLWGKKIDMSVGAGNTAYEDDGLDYEIDLTNGASADYNMSDIDDMYYHHYTNADSPYNDGWTQEYHQEQLNKMANTDHNFKYHEDEILKDIQEYVSRTYQGHYTGTKHEFRKVQTIDLMAARDIATDFCQANILKYGSRYGSKNGKNKTDLLKVIHYAMLLLHFDGHYGEPSMPSGNFDQMP